MVEMTWSWEDEWWICRKHVPAAKELCNWAEIDTLCSKLSALLDRHDRDRFAELLRYGTS